MKRRLSIRRLDTNFAQPDENFLNRQHTGHFRGCHFFFYRMLSNDAHRHPVRLFLNSVFRGLWRKYVRGSIIMEMTIHHRNYFYRDGGDPYHLKLKQDTN